MKQSMTRSRHSRWSNLLRFSWLLAATIFILLTTFAYDAGMARFDASVSGLANALAGALARQHASGMASMYGQEVAQDRLYQIRLAARAEEIERGVEGLFQRGVWEAQQAQTLRQELERLEPAGELSWLQRWQLDPARTFEGTLQAAALESVLWLPAAGPLGRTVGGLLKAGAELRIGAAFAAKGVDDAARFIVSPKGTAVERAIADRWAKGTFGNVVDSMEYHFAKHGGGRTLQQYTDDAVRFFQQNKGQAQWGKWNPNWEPAYRLKIGNQGGYFSSDGRVLTYWD